MIHRTPQRRRKQFKLPLVLTQNLGRTSPSTLALGPWSCCGSPPIKGQANRHRRTHRQACAHQATMSHWKTLKIRNLGHPGWSQEKGVSSRRNVTAGLLSPAFSQSLTPALHLPHQLRMMIPLRTKMTPQTRPGPISQAAMVSFLPQRPYAPHSYSNDHDHDRHKNSQTQLLTYAQSPLTVSSLYLTLPLPSSRASPPLNSLVLPML